MQTKEQSPELQVRGVVLVALARNNKTRAYLTSSAVPPNSCKASCITLVASCCKIRNQFIEYLKQCALFLATDQQHERPQSELPWWACKIIKDQDSKLFKDLPKTLDIIRIFQNCQQKSLPRSSQGSYEDLKIYSPSGSLQDPCRNLKNMCHIMQDLSRSLKSYRS